jgi:hypothetical protein
MLPVLQDRLSVDKIAHYWSLEIQPPRPSEELVDFLEAAWWLGKLKGQPPFTTRLALLKAIFRSTRAGDGTGVLFFTPEEPQGTEQPDGSLVFKSSDLMRARIPVPSGDPDMWTEPSLARAFEKLSEAPSRKHYPEHGVYVGFLLMQVHRDQFISLLREHGHDLPNFWRRPVDIPPEEEAHPHSPISEKAYHKDVPTTGPINRKRGRKPIRLEKSITDMRRDLEEGRQTPASLRDMPEKNLAATYGFSRDTVRKARATVMSKFVENS